MPTACLKIIPVSYGTDQQLAEGGYRKEGMTLKSFLREAQELANHLDMHHQIVRLPACPCSDDSLTPQEETYIFPILAKKMPQFDKNRKASGEHLKSHKKIHDGLDKCEAFLKDALAGPEYDGSKLKEIMDGFKEVLFRRVALLPVSS